MALKRQYQWIEKVVNTAFPIWVERLRLDHWEIEVAFLDSYYGEDGEEDFKVSAVTESRPQYEQAKIKFFLPSCARHDASVLTKVLVHELWHVVLSPEQGIIDEIRNSDIPSADKVADLYSYQVENCTERATQITLKAYPEVTSG